jgi:hypothetical protein
MSRISEDSLSRGHEFYTRRIAESKRTIWYLSTNGKCYSINKKDKSRHNLHCDTLNGIVRIPIEGLHSMQLKRLVWKTFKGNITRKQCVVVKDGNELNCSISNLEIMDLIKIPSKRKKPVLINGIEYPSVGEAAKEVPCSKTSLLNYLNGKTKGNSCLRDKKAEFKKENDLWKAI